MAASWLVILLLGTLTITQITEGNKVRSSCPPGWFFYKANCYGYFRYPLTWSDAEFDCQSYGHGAHLASIMDSAEGDIIAAHIFAYQKNQPVWIGLHDPEQNARWKWNDGSMFNYRSWLAGQPDNNKNEEHCGELSCAANFIKWNDSNCKLAKQYLCKYKP